MNMQRALVTTLLILLCSPAIHAQLVSGRLVTSFHTWEKFDTVGSSSTYLRAFQIAQLSIAQGDFSIHTYLQGALNAGYNFGDNGRVRAYNLYLRWANIGEVFDLSLGRQSVYAGVGVGTIDGVSLAAKMWRNQVIVKGYWGSTVRPEFTGVRSNWHDNSHFGGQLLVAALPGLRASASYMNRRVERLSYRTLRARDTTFTPLPYTIDYESPAEELLSGDVYYVYRDRFSIYGRYDYDLYYSKTSRAEGGARVNVTGALALTADFTYREPRIHYNSIFSAFVANSVKELEGGVEYGFTPLLRAFARFGRVSYTDDQSNRWTLGANTGYGSIAYSGSDGYAGQLQSISVSGSYPVAGQLVIPSLGVSYVSYRLSPADNRNSALSVLLGAIVRPARSFWCDIQAQWLSNKTAQRDLRLQLRLTYWFSQRLSLFGEEVQR